MDTWSDLHDFAIGPIEYFSFVDVDLVFKLRVFACKANDLIVQIILTGSSGLLEVVVITGKFFSFAATLFQCIGQLALLLLIGLFFGDQIVLGFLECLLQFGNGVLHRRNF